MIKKINPEWMLRLGLGLMYLYSGYDLMVKPMHWYGFVPRWFSQAVGPLISVEGYLRLQGLGELVIGLLFIAWFLGRSWVRFASVLAVAEMAMILLFVGIDPITFRDIGLLGAAVALLVMTFKNSVAAPKPQVESFR